ncbi:Meiosis-specific APC/C activator protein AMA1 [Nakaseomyces bracarensis]|uniref:Meiosis-specific APC/C activator protein AMA1 n=1 Tax=Nakaseomyces bracarensis TaxID=273131 RepID=A0ABR4NQZ1_9SACH
MDRHIPNHASKKAYEATNFMRNFNVEDLEILESSSSQERLSSPEFFNDMRSTGNYDLVGSLEHQLDLTYGTGSTRSNGSSNSSNQSSTTNSTYRNNSSQRVQYHRALRREKRKKIKGKPTGSILSNELRRHREYMASFLGFKAPDRVLDFACKSKKYTNENSLQDIKLYKKRTRSEERYMKVDPLINFLPPVEARYYIASNISCQSENLVQEAGNPRNTIRSKSHIPYRVLDAPCLRNDFYSNLVSWSKTTGNVIVGLGYSVYIWSETEGAIPVLNHNYLSGMHDLITCLSFCPYNEFFLVGTKQGKILLFDQNICLDSYKLVNNSSKLLPLTDYQTSKTKGISCIEWCKYASDDTRWGGVLASFYVGEESGEVEYMEIKHVQDPNEPQNSGSDQNELQLHCVNKFQAQSQQVCGMLKYSNL